MTRRKYLRASLLAVAGASVTTGASALAAPLATPVKVIGFSKPFSDYNPDDTADLVAEIGWSGIDCPIREKNTHIRPERIEEDLPKMVDALHRRGKEVTMVTTDILRRDERAEKILRTVAKLGIKKYRFGFAHYDKAKPVPETVREVGKELTELAVFNRELGLQGGYQNHSGTDYIGAPVWDLWLMMKDLDPATIGIFYDLGQGMIEGGLSWPVQARLTQSLWGAIQLKDFVWENDPAKGWNPRWLPLGEGRMTKAVFDEMMAFDFPNSIPLIQHHEHLKPGTPRAELIAGLKKDFATLRSWLGERAPSA